MELNSNLFYLFIVVFLFFIILLIIQLNQMNTNETTNKRLLQVVTIEGLRNNKNDSCVCDNNNDDSSNNTRNRNRSRGGNNNDTNDTSEDGAQPNEIIPPEPLLLGMKDFFSTDLAKDFCKSFQTNSDKLEKQCNKLTNSNCKSSGCCVLLNGQKCVAGSANGPTFQSTSNGSAINFDYYYYQNKCYGNNCPKKLPSSELASFM